ncbi:MAG: choice-of-anchor J domain-containing protein [Bacteroidales bacterium]|nr:choice-of-anchor J domain-containing protein [Bacteroidales bacterium]
MKKLVLFFLAVWASGTLLAQYQTQQEMGATAFRGQDPTTVVYKTNPATVTSTKATLDESFEGATFPPAGWTLVDHDGDGDNFFQYDVGSAADGLNSATSASWTSAGGALTPNNHLITPALLPVAGDNISFWYAAQDPDYPSDKFQVLVSKTGTNAADFTDTLYVKTITDTNWTQQVVSLNAYAGTTIYVSFNHFDCTDWFYMKLDKVEGPNFIPASIENASNTAQFNMYPNPASNVLNVNGTQKIDRVSIVNVVGQEVLVSEINATTSNIDISNLESGVYFVNIEVGTQRTVKKLTIKK